MEIIAENYSGPIPQADDFYKYEPPDRERMLRMAESSRTDESERRSLIVKAGIATNKRSSIIQPILFLGCVGCTAVSFWVFREYVPGAVFLSYPVLSFLAGVRWNWKRRDGSKKPPEES